MPKWACKKLSYKENILYIHGKCSISKATGVKGWAGKWLRWICFPYKVV